MGRPAAVCKWGQHQAGDASAHGLLDQRTSAPRALHPEALPSLRVGGKARSTAHQGMAGPAGSGGAHHTGTFRLQPHCNPG